MAQENRVSRRWSTPTSPDPRRISLPSMLASPNLQVLPFDPLRIGQDVKEILDCDLAAEVCRRFARSTRKLRVPQRAVKDYVTRDLFEKLMSRRRNPTSTFSRDPARPRRQARCAAVFAASHRRDGRGPLSVAGAYLPSRSQSARVAVSSLSAIYKRME